MPTFIAILQICLLLAFRKPLLATASLLENGVTGEPRVECGVDSISVWIHTEQAFHGRLYVEEESEHEDCVHSYSNVGKHHRQQSGGYDSHVAEFIIRFGQCNMRRQRVLNPRGVTYSFTLVVSFHPIFLTGIDKAFHIKCFFLEAVKAIDIALNVSPLTTITVEREFGLPQCTYNLKQTSSGPFLKFANIGEPITHVWQCDPVAGWVYGVLIHSCYVDDGRGNRFDLIDERGCATDKYLLGDIVYDERGLGAFVNTHVFRYADRIQLFFTCTLQLCFKEDGGCKGITPPKCKHHHGDRDDHYRHDHYSEHHGESRRHPGGGGSKPEVQTSPSQHAISPSHIPAPPRELLRKLSRRPLETVRNGLMPSAVGDPLFGNSYKDLPLNNETVDVAADTLLLETTVLADSLENGTVRTSRGTPTGGVMETDLSVDLTVLPFHETFSVNKPENGVKSMQNNPVNRSLEATTSTENSPTHIFTSAYSAAAAFNPVQVTSEMSRYSQSHRPFSPTPSLAPQMLRTHQEEVDGSCAHRAVRRYFLLLTIGFAVTVLISSLFTAIICLKLNDRIQSLIHRFKRARLLRGNRTNEYTY